MADKEPYRTQIVPMTPEREKKRLEIIVSEKKSQIKALLLRLEDLKLIESEKINLRISLLQAEIEHIESNMNPVDAEFKVMED